MSICTKLRDLGIEELKDKINKLKEIEFLQFLNSRIPNQDKPELKIEDLMMSLRSVFFKIERIP